MVKSVWRKMKQARGIRITGDAAILNRVIKEALREQTFQQKPGRVKDASYVTIRSKSFSFLSLFLRGETKKHFIKRKIR